MSKQQAQRAHAKRRFAERHHAQVSNRDLEEMAAIVRQGGARFVERQSNRVTVWDVDWEGRTRRVVYDKHRHQIVTLLLVEGES